MQVRSSDSQLYHISCYFPRSCSQFSDSSCKCVAGHLRSGGTQEYVATVLQMCGWPARICIVLVAVRLQMCGRPPRKRERFSDSSGTCVAGLCGNLQCVASCKCVAGHPEIRHTSETWSCANFSETLKPTNLFFSFFCYSQTFNKLLQWPQH
jgi:hypothetical protein